MQGVGHRIENHPGPAVHTGALADATGLAVGFTANRLFLAVLSDDGLLALFENRLRTPIFTSLHD